MSSYIENELRGELRRINDKLAQLERKIEEMSQTQGLSDLTVAIGQMKTVAESAIAAFAGVATLIQQANTNQDPAMEQLAADITAESTKLAAAIPQGTPAAPVAGGNPPTGTASAAAAAGAAAAGGDSNQVAAAAATVSANPADPLATQSADAQTQTAQPQQGQ